MKFKRKVGVLIVLLLFILPLALVEPVLSTTMTAPGRAAATAGSAQPAAPAVPTIPTVTMPISSRSKEIDDVWIQIRGSIFHQVVIGPVEQAATKIWHGGWVTFESVYPNTIGGQSGKQFDYSMLEFDDQTHIPAIIAESQRQSIDPCYAAVVVSHESKGKADVIGGDSDVPGCRIFSRRKLVLESTKDCAGFNGDSQKLMVYCLSEVDTTFTAYERPRQGVDDCLDAILDVKAYSIRKPTKENFCAGNFNKDYTWGIGLGQITPSAGTKEIIIAGQKYTHCDLFDPRKNIQAIISLLKQKGAGSVSPQEVFERYAGALTPGVTRRVTDYQACASVNKAVS